MILERLAHRADIDTLVLMDQDFSMQPHDKELVVARHTLALVGSRCSSITKPLEEANAVLKTRDRTMVVGVVNG